ncbi:MAG TPA: exodeoxyribonuclease V subunit gamma [Chthoniobacteraceae bacterium]|jgi:exodeoxyribonuclease V gamma subunit|nr:exodeoxyribonuclease V subunit gamma [Chthoniobacteraceae bacterium]
MAGLYVYRSNRLEALGERLAEVLRVPLPNPLQPETIVVQSLGMRRWISFELAARLGVTMNCHFPFFQEFAHGLLNPGIKTQSAFSRTALPWRILALLPRLIERPGFEPLQHYAGHDAQAALKQFQLANQIATVFDRYLAHSPERLLQWENKREQGWQAQLWRELAKGHAETHPPALLRAFTARAEANEPLPGVAPRLSVFGISGVPPFFLHLLQAAGRLIEVHLFLLEPTDQYWGDILSQREQSRLLRRPELKGRTAEDLHFEPANELLASFGRPGRAFSRDIEDLEPNDSEPLFVEPVPDTLLRAWQSDIFQVMEPMTAEEPARRAGEPGDASVQIHCCHGPMRELEVLHDRLLDLFERLPRLMPKDILVTMPEVETYAPYIGAVFNQADAAGQRLPFSIADRSAQAESSVAAALLKLLALHGGRFLARDVLGLLEIQAVRQRFGIAESELDDVRRWVDDTGIRWGIDAAHRAAVGLPSFDNNSWRAGLDRLLLGYALPGDGATLFEDVLPYPEIEGGDAALLGRFVDFCEKLFRLVPALDAPRPLAEWEASLRELLDTFIADHDDFAGELKRVRSAVRGVGALTEFHPGPVSFDVLRTHLATVLGDTEGGHGFLAGHVTFCSLKPMRSVPFRVICILGLNDTAFPRREPPLGFDLLAQEGRGRSRRDDDRQLFLETILSARDALYLSYSGLSPRDNSEAPPSVVVTELLDYTARNYEPALTVTKHPLQAFSTRYFGVDQPVFSYSAAALAASRASCAPAPAARATEPLGEMEAPEREVEVAALVKFFASPAKYFLEQRLKLRLPKAEEVVDDCEPLRVADLDRWNLQNRLLRGGSSVPQDLRVWQSEGVLPAGWFGHAEYEDMAGQVEQLLAAVGTLCAAGPFPPQPTRLPFGEWHLNGTLPDLFPEGIVHLVGWKVKAKDRLRAWIHHLFLNAAATHGPRTTRLFCVDRLVEFRPPADAAALLADLLELYARGLREPLPFFAESSFVLAKARLDGKSEYRARGKWEKKEKTDAHVDLCFRGRDPLDRDWEELSLRVYAPMIEHSGERKLG